MSVFVPVVSPTGGRSVLGEVRLGRTDPFPAPSQRYKGDGLAVRLSDLAEWDVGPLRALYAFLLELRAQLDRSRSQAALVAWLDEGRLDRAHEVARTLGRALRSGSQPTRVRQAYHDLRGGSLQALLMHLDLLLDGEGEEGDELRLFVLVRDQLKMMRNAVRDLDPDVYARDMQARGHAMALLHEKWGGVSYPGRRGSVHVSLHAPTGGMVAERCMEFSALDRVLYNLVNNAAQHAADGRVHIEVEPVDQERQLQFRVINRLTDDQHRRLVESFGQTDISDLMLGGYTTGGHGVGTRVCADMVRHGYGLDSVRAVLDGGYAGAQLVDGYFVAYFHWPAMPTETGGDEVDA
jgi:signal transduction histidine kinase